MTHSSFEKFYLTQDTIQTTVASSLTRIQSEQLAAYFAEDLIRLVNTAHIDLAREFQIPQEYSQDPQDIVSMLRDDIVHMLQDDLIDGIHLIISDSERDKGTNAYKVRYHVHYRVDTDILDTSLSMNDVQGRKLSFIPKAKLWDNIRFTLLIDWKPSASKSKFQVRRPQYYFDWVEEENRFAPTNLIRFYDASALRGSETGVRSETVQPKYVTDRNAQSPLNIEQGELPDRESRKAEDAPFSLYALARVVLEDDDKALVGKTYSAQAGVSCRKPEGFTGELFDIPSQNITVPLSFDLLIHTSEHIKLTTDWHKKLLFDPHKMEPQLVDFTFQVVVQGHGSLSIDFYQDRRWLRTIRVEFESVERLQGFIVLSEG